MRSSSAEETTRGKGSYTRVGSYTAGASSVSHQVGPIAHLVCDDSVRSFGGNLSPCSRYSAQLPPCISRGSLSLKDLFAIGSFLIAVLLGAAVSADAVNVYFKTSPVPEHLRPFTDPATFSLLVTGADGKPLTKGSVHVRLQAPRSSSFFSTDLPLVEGTQLTDLRMPLKVGKAEWKYAFPIRGRYRLIVDVLALDGTKVSRTFELNIREHRTKWLVLGGFTVGLFAFGFITGRMFTSPARNGHEAARIILLVMVSVFTFPGELALGQTGGDKLAAGLEIDSPRVGKPARITWRLQGSPAIMPASAMLSLTVIQVEKGNVVFAFDRLPVEAEYSMNFQFTDGGEYRVNARAELPGGKLARAEQLVTVTGVEPSIPSTLPAIGFFLAVVAAGLAMGRWSRRHATQS
jgi:hypothetical protein